MPEKRNDKLTAVLLLLDLDRESLKKFKTQTVVRLIEAAQTPLPHPATMVRLLAKTACHSSPSMHTVARKDSSPLVKIAKLMSP